MTPEQEQHLRDAAAGGWTFDGRAQPLVGDLHALLDEVDRLRGIARTAADKLERVGYDETASRIRARVNGEAVGLGG